MAAPPSTRTTATIDDRPPSRNAPQEYSPRDSINHGFETLEEGQVVGHFNSRCLFWRSTKITERPTTLSKETPSKERTNLSCRIYIRYYQCIPCVHHLRTLQRQQQQHLSWRRDLGVLAHLTLTPPQESMLSQVRIFFNRKVITPLPVWSSVVSLCSHSRCSYTFTWDSEWKAILNGPYHQ